VQLLDGWGAVFAIITLLIGLVLHEVMHAATASMFGDPTAPNAGRLTLNPLRHLDPFGSVILPGALLILAVTGTGSGAVFGYARPVPVQIGRLRRPRIHSLAVSLAGPTTNLLLGLVGALVLRLLTAPVAPRLLQFLLVWVLVNLVVAAFNFLPVPPLDGSEMVAALLPEKLRSVWYGFVRQFGFIVLLVLLLLFPRVLDTLISPILDFLIRLALSP
jgi:Zn-dependent protease